MRPLIEGEKLVTVQELSKILDKPKRNIHRYISEGYLEAEKVKAETGGAWSWRIVWSESISRKTLKEYPITGKGSKVSTRDCQVGVAMPEALRSKLVFLSQKTKKSMSLLALEAIRAHYEDYLRQEDHTAIPAIDPDREVTFEEAARLFNTTTDKIKECVRRGLLVSTEYTLGKHVAHLIRLSESTALKAAVYLSVPENTPVTSGGNQLFRNLEYSEKPETVGKTKVKKLSRPVSW